MLLTPLSTLVAQQAALTKAMLIKAKQFLDSVASQDEAVLTYRASNVVQAVHSDAGYLGKPNA